MSLDVLSPAVTIRDIAAQLPGAARVFREAGISFCCGGGMTLPEAAAQSGTELGGLVAELRDLIDRAAKDAPSGTLDLIDYILDRYHATHRQELAFLISLGDRVEKVHGDHEEAPLGLTQTLTLLGDGLESHMATEEDVLFPAIIKGSGAALLMEPLRAMREDHATTLDLLRRIEHITHGLALPEGACGSWTALYTGLRKFCEDVVAHIHLEETVLFPRVAAA